MAIRRRANEVLTLSAIAFLCANIYTYTNTDNSNQSIMTRNVTYYNHMNPPPCGKPVEEAIRLNELIANAWYKCKRTKRIPDESLGFHICVDDLIGIQHVLSGDRLAFVSLAGMPEDYRLEKTLLKITNINRLLSGLIISTRPTFPILLRDHASRLLYTSINEEDLNSIDTLSMLISNRLTSFALNQGEGSVDILKMACLDCWKSHHLPKLLDSLRSSGSLNLVKQIHLTLRIDRMEPELSYLWYKTIHGLFFTGGAYFALYAAQQLGECGRTIINCQYQLAFAKIDAVPPIGISGQILAPVAGMGSPDEEYNRLIWYLNKDSHAKGCSNRFTGLGTANTPDTGWIICQIFNKESMQINDCHIYHFGIGTANAIVDNWQRGFPAHCKLHAFDPTLPFDQHFPTEMASLYSVTLADKSSGDRQPGLDQSNPWHLSRLNELLEKTNPDKLVISLMVVDLEGGEWDVFEQILSAAAISAFSQLIMRVRIWQGEENENYRKFYSWLFQMERMGYTPFDFRMITTNYTRDRMECKPNWCYELGWILL